MTENKALIYFVTGVSGQDGFFSARHFLKRGYRVVGISRRPISESNPHLSLLSRYNNYRHIHLHEYTFSYIRNLFLEIKPNRVLHCAGFRDIPTTPDEVAQCFFTNCDILEMLLDAIVKFVPKCRLLFLSSAEIFSRDAVEPLNEKSPIRPENEYGISKVRGMQIIKHVRSTRNIFALSAICFNHDSFLSPVTHLVKLVPKKLLMWKYRLISQVSFFNVNIRRDFSHVKDFVDAFDLMLAQTIPEDLVVASGVSTTIQDYINLSCDLIGIKNRFAITFEICQDKDSYDRVANPERLKTKLGWTPKYDITKLCKEMIGWESHAYRMLNYNKIGENL